MRSSQAYFDESDGEDSGSELLYASPAIPGGSFLASVYDRTYMQLSDRGGASNAIGDRWAELCAIAMADSLPDLRVLPGTDTVADCVIRLDDVPEIARAASRRQLQNPDFLLVGNVQGRKRIWAADAKFSVDTARSKQVSAQVVEALVHMGGPMTAMLPDPGDDAVFENGLFLCPDYPLTNKLLTDRRGPRKATVRRDEVRCVPVAAAGFLEPMGQEGLRQFLAELDDFPFDPLDRLMVGLYYYRLARVATGCWQDRTDPLLAYRDVPVVDPDAVEAEARSMATMRTSAWGLMLRWNDLAELVRGQRAEVDQVTSVPIKSKELREWILAEAEAAGVVAPSASKVRRAIGSWFRSQIREEFGPIYPPVRDFPGLLARLGQYSRSLTSDVEAKSRQTIERMIAESPPAAESPS